MKIHNKLHVGIIKQWLVTPEAYMQSSRCPPGPQMSVTCRRCRVGEWHGWSHSTQGIHRTLSSQTHRRKTSAWGCRKCSWPGLTQSGTWQCFFQGAPSGFQLCLSIFAIHQQWEESAQLLGQLWDSQWWSWEAWNYGYWVQSRRRREGSNLGCRWEEGDHQGRKQSEGWHPTWRSSYKLVLWQ